MAHSMTSHSRLLSGICPDEKCQAKLFFPSHDISIECTDCGQRHEKSALRNLEVVTNPNIALRNVLVNLLISNSQTKKEVELVKVKGLSNYHCKLLSPFLTYNGMDRRTWKACPLKDLNQGEIFDCSVLGDRAFLLDPEHVEINGYGRDISGSATYLADTLEMIRAYNNDEELLIPIHADGDGHCLVHAVSRALVGRELFWHPLRISLKRLFEANLDKYAELFHDFIDASEWTGIIEECDPDFQPADGEPLGLRNIHVFGLANVLRRPIILLDSLSGMQSSGDYSAMFLPKLVEPDLCRDKAGKLNKPICIAWSSSGRNHYIPLVGVKRAHGRLPRLPRSLIPKPWGVPESLVDSYVDFDEDNCCVIGGDKCLQDSYILKLAKAMEELFINVHGVHPAVVADVHQYVYKKTGLVGILPREVLSATQKAIMENRLYRCIICDAVCEQNVIPEWLNCDGVLYKLAEQQHGRLREDKLYSFPTQGVICTYDGTRDELIPDIQKSVLEKCSFCRGNMRLINRDGTTRYQNGDRTKTPSKSNACNCGHKHYWDGEEYDNLPQVIPVTLDWKNNKIDERVAWFQFETNPSLNSNVYQIANNLIQKHYPGEFGIERLAQKIVDQILEKTKRPEEAPPPPPMSAEGESQENSPSKIIIMGFKSIHKEELTKSETERAIRQRVQTNAAKHQRRTSVEKSITLNSRSPISPGPAVPKNVHKPSPDRSGLTSPKHVSIPTASPAKLPVSTAKMIRISTSDGRQLQIPLEDFTTIDDLKSILEDRLGIPIPRQRILHGFPPKELTISKDDVSKPLPFQHGDKLSVEILPNLVPNESLLRNLRATTSQISTILSSQSGRDELGQRLLDLQNSNVDNLDAAVTSLALAASLSGQTLAQYVEKMPHLFAEGGIFYQLVERDVGLVAGKHFRLPYILDKVFSYNAVANRLELCAEPHGHFAVEPGVLTRVPGKERPSDEQQFASKQEELIASVLSSATANAQSSGRLAGSSGVVISKAREILATHTPFQGQGYSLGGKSQVSSTEDSFDEVEKMEATESTDSIQTVRTRTAPGVSVLSSQQVPSVISERNERLQSLLRSVEQGMESFNTETLNSEEVEDDVENIRNGSQELCTDDETMD